MSIFKETYSDSIDDFVFLKEIVDEDGARDIREVEPNDTMYKGVEPKIMPRYLVNKCLDKLYDESEKELVKLNQVQSEAANYGKVDESKKLLGFILRERGRPRQELEFFREYILKNDFSPTAKRDIRIIIGQQIKNDYL